MKATVQRLRQRRDNGEGGFTLIELLIVIVVLGILAAIVVFAVQNLTGTSAQASCKTDYKSVETAAEAYKAQTSAYPTDVNAMVPNYLKELPTNAGHYQIHADAGVISVWADPVGATPLAGTGIAACTSVN
jgi:prepilin-type N-terminal cleavage/methylation domain-containing protein